MKLEFFGVSEDRAFDKAYISAMVKDHKEDLEEFKTEAANGRNDAVKEAANKGSTAIEGHLQMINQSASALLSI